MKNVMAVKLGLPGAIAYGNEHMCISGVYGTGEKGISDAELRQRLEEDFNVSRAEAIFVDRHSLPRSKRLVPQFEVLRAFCEEKQVPLHEVYWTSSRAEVAGGRCSRWDVMDALQAMGPRNLAEADAMALLAYGTT